MDWTNTIKMIINSNPKPMKRLASVLTACLMLAGTAMSQSSAVLDFSKKYRNDQDYFSLRIEGGLLKMLNHIDSDDSDTRECIKALTKIDGIEVHSIKRSSSDFRDTDYSDLMKQVKKEKFEDLMIVNDSDSKINFMVKDSGGKIHDLLMLVNDNHEFLIMEITGEIDLHSLSKLSDDLDIRGCKELAKLDK